MKYRITGLCLLLCGWLSAQVSLEMRVEAQISQSGSYDVALVTDISEPARDTYPSHSYIHSLKSTLTLPEGFTPDLDAMEIVAQEINLNQAFEWVNSSAFDPATRQLTMEVSVEVKKGEELPLGFFSCSPEKKILLRVPLNFTWSADKVGKYALTDGTAEMTVGQTVDGQFVAVSAGPDAVRLTVPDLEIYSDFLMGGEPLTQNGTEDFADEENYNPLIQGINYAFSGSGVYNHDTQVWESINGKEIEVHDMVETDAQGVPVPEEKHIFRIVNRGVDNFELYSVPDANGHSYLKFTVAAKRYPEIERSFLMSYVVDPADDPYELTAEVGPGTEGQPYSITVNITDIDNDPLDYVKQDGNYDFFIRINGRDFETQRFAHAMPFTLELAEPLPFDLIANGENGQRSAAKAMTVQYVSRKLYAPGKGDEMVSPEQTVTFTDVDHLPEGVDFELQVASPGKTDDDVVAECKLIAGSDADGDEIQYQGVWTLNGSGKTVAGLTLPASETQKGQTWTLTAEAFTQPYGEPIMTGVTRTATYVVEDAVPVIASQPERLNLRDDQSTSATVTVVIDDGDIADGTDTYTVDNFSVIQSQNKGVISGETWNADTQSFSFDYRIANPQEGIAVEEGVNLVVEVSHNGTRLSTQPIAVTYVLNQPPQWTGAPRMTVKENDQATLDLATLVADVDTADTLTFGLRDQQEPGITMELNGSLLNVKATYDAVTGTDTNKKLEIPVTVTDGRHQAVPAVVTVTVENVNRQPQWKTGLALAVKENEQGQLNLTNLVTDPDQGDALSLTVDTVTAEGVTASLNGKLLTVAASYDAVKGQNTSKTVSIPVTATDGFKAKATGTVTVTVMAVNRIPSWNHELSLDVKEHDSQSLDLTKLAKDPDGDELTFGKGTLNENGFTAKLEGKTLTVTATYEAVTTAEKTKEFQIPVTVKDAQDEPVTGTVVVTVTNVNQKPAWNETLTLSVNENESKSLDLSELAKDPDGDELTFSEGTLNETGFTAKLEGKTLTVTVTYEAVSHAQLNDAEGTKTFDIPVMVKDTQGEPVEGTVRVTVTDVNQAPVATMEEKQFDYGTPMPFTGKEFFVDLDEDVMTYVVTGLNLGRILDTDKKLVTMGEHLNANRFPLVYEKEEGADPVPVSFQIVAVDSLKAKSEAMTVKIVMHTSQLASELWSGKESSGGMLWIGLHRGWNLLAVPFDMTEEDFEAFRHWLIPEGSFWGWKAELASFKPLTSLMYNDGFWVFIEKLPQEDFQLSGQLVSERPKPYGWQLVSKVWAWNHGNKKAFLYNSEIGGLMRVSAEDSPYVGVWQYFPRKNAQKAK